MQNIRVVLFLLSVYIQEKTCLYRSCSWSIRTLQYVSDCPTTKEDVEKAARIKDCEALAEKQSCTQPAKFKYHCVINDQGNALVEVCAPVYNIHGFCTEFNVPGLVIQPHYDIPCSNTTPCTRYLSTSAYLYPKCYDVIKNRTTVLMRAETTTPFNNVTVHVSRDESEDRILYLKISVVIALLISLTALFGWWYRRKRVRASLTKKTKYNTEEVDEENLLPLKNKKAKQLEVDSDCESLISHESLTDESVAVAPGQLLRKMFTRTETEEERYWHADENKDSTENYINSFRSFETYFVETGVFQKCKRMLQKKGVAVVVGPSGCGKTTAAIGIMKDGSYKDWVKRKISSWTEFRLIDSERNSLIYIDNIFDGFMYQQELEKWWNMFNTVFHENISPKDNTAEEDNGFVSKTGGIIHLLITAKESVLPKAREYNMIRKTPVFKKNCTIFTDSSPLTDDEKDAIFDKQVDYAEKILDIQKPLVDPAFRREMKSSVCPVGFPICAHLYACEKEHRQTGVDFFLYPIKYLQKQIKYEIDMDFTNSKKTLLLMIFLRECLSLSTGCEKHLDLRDSNRCKEFLIQEFSDKMVEKIGPLFEGNLEKVADTLTVMIVGQNEGVYRFKHQVICDAVGFYFCTKWPEAVFKYFPIDAFEKHEFVSSSPEFCDSFLSRVLDEVNNRNVSKALACVALKQEAFARRFCEVLRSKDELETFFVLTDTASSYSLPPVFWISKYNHMKLSTLLDELIKEKAIQIEHNFYLARFGECCANDENFLRKTDANAFSSTTALKRVVLQYTGDNKVSILQLVTMSERNDYNAFMIIKKLLTDGTSKTFRSEIASNPCGQRVANCAAREKRYSRILCILALYEGDTDSKQKPSATECSPIQAVLEVVMDSSYSVHLELEMLIRVCLFIAYGVDPNRKTCNGQLPKDMCGNTNWKNIHAVLCLKRPNQVKMSKVIAKLLTEIDMPHENAPNINIPNRHLSKPLLKVIKTYVHHFAMQELYQPD